MAIFDVARQIYLVAKDDATLSAQVRTEYESLASSFVNDGETAFELTSATVNGQSFSGNRTMTKGQRLRMLGLVIKMLSEDAAFSSEGKADLGTYGT